MAQIVIIGGGWAGVSAAVAAKKTGAQEVILLERTDLLLGTGLVGGIMRNNGRFTAAEELIAMGGGELIQLTDQISRHHNLNFPGHQHASLYDVLKIEPLVKNYLIELGVKLKFQTRITDVNAKDGSIKEVISAAGEVFSGDVFIETTGGAGPQQNCKKHGNGCAMCILRCPTFGPRVSIASKLGIVEKTAVRIDGGLGAISGSCKLVKETLAPQLIKELDERGVLVIPIPHETGKKQEILAKKACQQYAIQDYGDNLIILDTGHAKLMIPFFSLQELRKVPGFESVSYKDPYGGGIGNSIRFMSISPRDNNMKVTGSKNLFCGGEKAGSFVGHTEAIVSGYLAGYNAGKLAVDKEFLEFPPSLVIGDFIVYGKELYDEENPLIEKCTFSGSVFYERMLEKELYTTDLKIIRKRVKKALLENIFAKGCY